MKTFFLVSFLSLYMVASIEPDRPDTSSTNSIPFYGILAEIDIDTCTIYVHLNLTVPNHFIEGDSLSFLFSSAAAVASISGKQLVEYTTGEAGPELSIYNLRFDHLTESTTGVELVYSLVIPDDHQVNRLSANWIEMNIDSFWHPILTSFPRFHYRLKTNLGTNYQIFTGDKVFSATEDSANWVIESAFPRIDISLSASREFYSIDGTYSMIFSTSRSTDLEKLMEMSDQALTFLKMYSQKSEDFIEKRIVVESPREDVGYARENYIMLSKLDEMDPISISLFLAHEFSHFWFMQSNPQTQDHWLNESFAEFLAMIYIREAFGIQTYLDNIEHKMKRISSDPRSLASQQGRPSHITMYYTGPIILHHFEEYLGVDRFRHFIQLKIRERISTTEALLKLVYNHFGADAEEKLISLLNTEF